MKRKVNYIIYKAENKADGKVYIGATTESLEARKQDHIQRSSKDYKNSFQDAINAYGEEAFIWEQIDTANSVNELAKKEKEYIIKYDSKEGGYNEDAGGGFQKNVYMYNLNGELEITFTNLIEAASFVGTSKQQISKTCLSVNQFLSNYYWSYEYQEPFEAKIDSRKKEVHQYSLDGKFIKTFSSIKSATKATGVNNSSISKVCRRERKSAGGFYWTY